MNRDDQDDSGSYDGDLFSDAMAAYKEVSAKAPEAPAPEIKADVTEAEVVTDDKPVVESKTDDAGRVRGADGKFVAKSDGRPTETKVDTKVVDDKKPPAASEPASASPVAAVAPPAGGPPPSWSIKAKAMWDKLPDEIKADVVKREGEVAQGLQALRDYKDLKPYADTVRAQGLTIPKALDRYMGLENLLKQNLGQGLAVLAQGAGLNSDQASQLFAKMATHYSNGRIQLAAGGQPNAGQPAAQADPLVEAMRPLLGPLMQEIDGLKRGMSTREQADRNASAQSLAKAIEEFGIDPANRYFSDAKIEEQVTLLIEKGVVPLTGNHKADLKAAYDLACRMHPEVHEALIEQRLEERKAAERQKEQEAAEKARLASRSLTGSRVPGARVVEPRDDKAEGFDDIEADVRRAFRVHASR